MKRIRWCVLGAMLTSVGLFAGCSNSASKPEAPAKPTATAESDADHAHGEWWCAEHGVPEEICAQCDVELVADFKAKGDWCAEHDRPDSQCFICNPEKEKEFAAQYEAKYGSQPPARESEGEGHDHEHEHDHEHAEEAKS